MFWMQACKAREVKLCAAMSAAALVAAHSSQHFEGNQQRPYMVATLIDSRKYLEPVLHDNNIGKPLENHISLILET